jgi:hypothetical protein
MGLWCATGVALGLTMSRIEELCISDWCSHVLMCWTRNNLIAIVVVVGSWLRWLGMVTQ